MDTNPFATNANNPAIQGQTPSYLQQTNNPTYAGAVSNMIKAIMQGNDQYKQKMQQNMGNQQMQSLSPGSAVPGAVGMTSVGGPNGPMPVVPPGTIGGSPVGFAPPSSNIPLPQPRPTMAPQTPVSPAAAPSNPTAAPISMDPATQAMMAPGTANLPSQPFDLGTNPVMSADPVTNALMSPIPGMPGSYGGF